MKYYHQKKFVWANFDWNLHFPWLFIARFKCEIYEQADNVKCFYWILKSMKLRPHPRQSPSCESPVVVIPWLTKGCTKLLFIILILLQCLSGLGNLYFRSSVLSSLSFCSCLRRLIPLHFGLGFYWLRKIPRKANTCRLKGPGSNVNKRLTKLVVKHVIFLANHMS